MPSHRIHAAIAYTPTQALYTPLASFRATYAWECGMIAVCINTYALLLACDLSPFLASLPPPLALLPSNSSGSHHICTVIRPIHKIKLNLHRIYSSNCTYTNTSSIGVIKSSPLNSLIHNFIQHYARYHTYWACIQRYQCIFVPSKSHCHTLILNACICHTHFHQLLFVFLFHVLALNITQFNQSPHISF